MLWVVDVYIPYVQTGLMCFTLHVGVVTVPFKFTIKEPPESETNASEWNTKLRVTTRGQDCRSPLLVWLYWPIIWRVIRSYLASKSITRKVIFFLKTITVFRFHLITIIFRQKYNNLLFIKISIIRIKYWNYIHFYLKSVLILFKSQQKNKKFINVNI